MILCRDACDWFFALMTKSSHRFAALSVTSFSINIGVTAGLKAIAGVPGAVGFAVALIITTVVNFAGLRYFVFPAKRPSVHLLNQFLAFVSATIGFRFGEYMSFMAIQTWIGLPETFAVLIVLSTSILLKFSFYGKVVFRTR